MLLHHALLYGDERQFLAVAVPFLLEGLEVDDAVLAVISEPHIAAVRAALGSRGNPVTFVPAGGFFRHPVRALATCRNIVQASRPRRLWALTEPVWKARTVAQATEWKRYEAAVNMVFATEEASVVCAYDLRSAPQDVVDSACRTHPKLLGELGVSASREYLAPDGFHMPEDDVALPAPGVRPDVLPLRDDPRELRAVREFLGRRALEYGLETEPTKRLLMAADEVAGNAIQHGAPPMQVRAWAEDGWMSCEVADYGHWHAETLVGYLPPVAGESIGLWGVRLLADTVQLRTGWDGTVVRLGMSLEWG